MANQEMSLGMWGQNSTSTYGSLDFKLAEAGLYGTSDEVIARQVGSKLARAMHVQKSAHEQDNGGRTHPLAHFKDSKHPGYIPPAFIESGELDIDPEPRESESTTRAPKHLGASAIRAESYNGVTVIMSM